MMPEHEDVVGHVRLLKGRWYRPIRCAICKRFNRYTFFALRELVTAPEPRQEWILCAPCHEVLLVELRRSSVRLPVRLRVAVALVAAERSPYAYKAGGHGSELYEFQREFTWGIRFMVFFALLHVVIFAILLSIPR